MAGLFRGETFDTNKDIPDLSGRSFLVTGGSAGIGLGIASHILQHNPKRLLFLSNREDHAVDTLRHLKQYGDTSKVEWVQCDLNDLKQVEKVGRRLAEKESELDVLVLNAGLGVGKFDLSKDGYDTHFQTNVLSHFLLAKMLLPNLKKKAEKTGDSRIVFQSSSLHIAGVKDVKFESIEEINTDVGPSILYNRTKLADILVAFKIDRDLKAAGVNNVFVNTTHPGLVGTEQQEQAVDAYGKWMGAVFAAMTPAAKDPIDEGCRPALFAATMPDVGSEADPG